MLLKCASAVLCCWFCPLVFSQTFNFNLGAGPGFPLNKTSDFTNVSYHLVAGAGPNLSTNIKMSAEFMFHGLPVSDRIANEIGISDVKGRFYALTGNLILGHSTIYDTSTYIIAGGGWYRRTLEAKQTVLRAGEVCAPVWTWWNVECVNGVFPHDETLGSRTSSAGGFNVGLGLAFRLGDSATHLYTEVRYHHAFTRNIATTVLPVTFGVRW